MYNSLKNKEAKLAVVGLGYVGLPIALEFAKDIEVIGFDINADRVAMMQNGIDPSNELDSSAFDNKSISFTANIEDLREANFFVVAVPTPIDESNTPNLKPLLGASTTVGKVLKKGDYVVFESTVYPGCTEEDCVPILEKESGLKFNEDFKVGYSPERINPGDKEHTVRTIKKIVSGSDDEALEEIAKTYEIVVDAGIHKAASIAVAEAAKVIENTQRDVNIALINELSIIFNKLNINTFDVLEAAGTKWNFLKFQPGLVGGHCIGVDPYYLTHKAEKIGHHAKVILSGRGVNDGMGAYVGKETVKKILARGENIKGANILVLGATFKEDVSDIRNSKVVDVINELESFNVNVDWVDPHADAKEVMHEYNKTLADKINPGSYSAVILAVPHQEYKALTQEEISSYFIPNGGVFVDLKGIQKVDIPNVEYWSL